jgi:hypothetical protein
MTLLEIEQLLPNGLHDAEVRKITIDYERRKVTVDLAVWVGEMDDPPERREAYKEGQLEISGLLFFAIEPPDASYPFQNDDAITYRGRREHFASGETLPSNKKSIV